MRVISKKRQINLDLTPRNQRILMFLSERTESISTNGINKGEVSPAAMIRRICDGEVQLIYNGKKIDIPLNLFFDIT